MVEGRIAESERRSKYSRRIDTDCEISRLNTEDSSLHKLLVAAGKKNGAATDTAKATLSRKSFVAAHALYVAVFIASARCS